MPMMLFLPSAAALGSDDALFDMMRMCCDGEEIGDELG